MPIFGYECSACQYECDVIENFRKGPARICPECGEKTLNKQVSAPAMVNLKGDGFYVNEQITVEEVMKTSGMNREGNNTTINFKNKGKLRDIFSGSELDDQEKEK